MDLVLSYLVFPKNSPQWHATEPGTMRAVERRIPLLLLPSLAGESEEILIFKSGRALTGKEFQALRRSSWVRIETEEPYRIIRALDLTAGELGILPIPAERHSDT